jgi:hypothetical protein
MTEAEKVKQFLEEVKSGARKTELTNGVFGEDGVGIVEEVIKTEDGIYVKYLGCSHLYAGYSKHDMIDSIAGVKRVLMEGIKLLTKNPVAILIKKKDLIDWFTRIYEADLEKKVPAVFCPPQREIQRVLELFLVSKLAKCFVSFLEDGAYRFIVQDLFGELDKNFDNVRTEVLRLIDLVISRESCGLAEKFKVIRKLAYWVLLIPKYRRITSRFLREIDIDKVELTEADWYFCLARKGYNFCGSSYEERLKLKNELDKQKGHIILTLQKSEQR